MAWGAWYYTGMASSAGSGWDGGSTRANQPNNTGITPGSAHWWRIVILDQLMFNKRVGIILRTDLNVPGSYQDQFNADAVLHNQLVAFGLTKSSCSVQVDCTQKWPLCSQIPIPIRLAVSEACGLKYISIIR